MIIEKQLLDEIIRQFIDECGGTEVLEISLLKSFLDEKDYSKLVKDVYEIEKELPISYDLKTKFKDSVVKTKQHYEVMKQELKEKLSSDHYSRRVDFLLRIRRESPHTYSSDGAFGGEGIDPRDRVEREKDRDIKEISDIEEKISFISRYFCD